MTAKEEFVNAYTNAIKRAGAEKLLNWLQNSTDFFTAPASSRHHLARPCGLVEHSLNVYDRLCRLVTAERESGAAWAKDCSDETVAIVSLLHDVCKANYYKQDTRNIKQNGQWVQVPYYTVEDQMPYGHGEKSAFIIDRLMRLTVEEATAIRFHMGGFGQQPGDYSMTNAYYKYPLAVLTHIADIQATYLDEQEEQP